MTISISKFRLIIAAMLLISTAINYTDRVTLSVLIDDIQKHLHLSDVDYSEIIDGFLIAYAVMYAVSGYLIDRMGTRLGFAVFASVWSVAQMLHGLAMGKWSLAASRVFLGLSEPGNFPAATKAVREWFPVERRALGVGIFNAGSSLGAAVAAPLAAWLGLRYGWRWGFFVTGSLGLFWVCLWLVLYQPPHRCRWISADEREAAPMQTESRTGEKSVIAWSTLLRSRDCMALALARFLSDPVIYFIIFWLPKYLQKERHFDLAAIGKYAWMPYVFGDIGYIAGGWFSGLLINRGWSVLSARKAAMLIGVCLLPAAILTPFVHSPAAAIAATCLVVLGHAIWIANLLTLPADLFPESIVGTASGLSGMGGSVGGLIANFATGYVVSRFTFRPIFILAGLLHPLSMLVIFWMLPTRSRFSQPKLAEMER